MTSEAGTPKELVSTIHWSDKAMVENAPGLSYWTGWKRTASQARLVGQFLWTGEAQFWSGQCETVFYYHHIIVPSIEVLETQPLYRVLEAHEFYDKVIQLATQGYLYMWKNGRRLRPVRSVGWKRWPRDEE